MKNLYLSILILLLIPLSLIKAEKDGSHEYSSMMMDDTVTLTVQGGEARIGEQICVSIIGGNFKDILAFQWQIQFDPSILSYTGINVNPSITMLSMVESEASSGILKMVHLDVENPITIDSLPLMELCFEVVGISEDFTYVNIVNGERIPVEIVKSGNPDQPVLYNLISEGISIINTLDCGLILYCPQRLEFTFSPDMVIRKKDFIESYDLYLDCFGYKDEDIRLINMSDPNSRPADSLVMTCENVFYTTSIGAVVEGYSMRSENGMTFMDTAAFLLCQVPIKFNIPDEYDDCVNSLRSCIDPLQCRSTQINVTEAQTVVEYEVLLDSTEVQSCDLIVFSQFEEITAIPDPYPTGFALDCDQYTPEITVNLGIEANISEHYFFLASEWCTSEITVTGYEEICPIDTVNAVDIPVTLNADNVSLQLNGVALPRVDSRLFSMSKDALLGQNNFIDIKDGTVGSFNGVSTLDVVLMYRYLIDENPGTVEAIAGDVDLSGSLTTADLGIVRYNILGIDVDPNIGRPFLLEKNEPFEGFDFLDFTNDYYQYVFDRAELNATEGLEFELFTYGDLNGNASQFHKSIYSKRARDVNLNDRWINEGDLVEIPIKISSEKNDPVIALDMSFNLSNFMDAKLTSAYFGSEFLQHKEDHTLNVSFLKPDNHDEVHWTLKATALASGRLSNMLSINTKGVNEVVTETLAVSSPELQFLDEVTTDDVNIYPNPAYDAINIMLPQSKVGSTIMIYNALGQMLKSELVTSTEHRFDTDELNAHGLLQLVIVNGDEISSFKVVTHR